MEAQPGHFINGLITTVLFSIVYMRIICHNCWIPHNVTDYCSHSGEAFAMFPNLPKYSDLRYRDVSATAFILLATLKKARGQAWKVLTGTSKLMYKRYELLPLPGKVAVHLSLLLGGVYLATQALAIINAGFGSATLQELETLDSPILDFGSNLDSISDALEAMPDEGA